MGSYPVATTWSRDPVPHPPPPTQWLMKQRIFAIAPN
jgi:hypothetical protein